MWSLDGRSCGSHARSESGQTPSPPPRVTGTHHHVPDGTGGQQEHPSGFYTWCFFYPGIIRASCASWNPFSWHCHPCTGVMFSTLEDLHGRLDKCSRAFPPSPTQVTEQQCTRMDGVLFPKLTEVWAWPCALTWPMEC